MGLRYVIFLAWMIGSVLMGGLHGALYGFLIFGLLAGGYSLMNDPEGPQNGSQRRAGGVSKEDEEEVTLPARKGSRIDPTRPTEEDYAAMITDNFKGRMR